MSLYLKAKKVDLKSGNSMTVLINYADAQKDGFKAGDRVWLSTPDFEHVCIVNVTDVEVEEGSIGLFSDIWKYSSITEDSVLRVEKIGPLKSLKYIAKKLQGEVFNEEEMNEVMKDISKNKLRSSDMAYFMATMFNPGFNDDEVLYAIKGMVNSGEVLDFKNMKKNGSVVVDKHSIGGVPGKGVTPLLVPIIASFGLVIPNTSTRAITAPAGTTDILEVVMPVQLETEKIYDVVRKTGGSLVWGGNLKIAPADDVLIRVEKGLDTQCYQKFIISIIAKKLAMGISHILIDLPYGPNTKVSEVEDVQLVSEAFSYFFDKVGIDCKVHKRFVKGPDGRGIGPNLEILEVLKILDDEKGKSVELEDIVVEMTGDMLEFVGKAKEGFGAEMVRERLSSGKVAEKFWEIAFAQGCKKKISSGDIKLAKNTFDVVAKKEGKIKGINNQEILKLCRLLGTPNIKEAGIYFHKFIGDSFKKGDVLLTFYAINNDILKKVNEVYEEEILFSY